MKCPCCGRQRFYVKGSEDDFETFSFDCSDGSVVFDSEIAKDDVPEVSDGSHIFCDKCAWNGNLSETKNK